MEYKGYTALIEYSAEDECLIGHVIGINDRLGFDGESIVEITQAFHDVLDNYLALCERAGKLPEQPKSGKLSLRLPVELHAYVAQQAESSGESINNIIIDAVRSFRDKERRAVARKTKQPSRRKTRKTHATAKAAK
ncbi:MAG: type II toxin-antitoxin system HicB family antitoxin [Parabacteroides sp.]|nr:type II toxin-antitoxin system HicB family antitoxin [Parabacteroides sp.]